MSAARAPQAHDGVQAGRSELLDGSPWRAIWRISWPLVLTMIANALIGLLDTWIAGRIDPTSQAAVRLSMQLVLLINGTITAASIGCQALVARFVGANDWPEAGRAAQQSLLLGLWLSLALLAPVYVFAPWLFQAMGASPAVQEAGAHYLRMILPGLLPMDMAIVLNAIFRARGRTQAMLVSNSVESVVWAAGSLGLGLVAGWGLSGLAAGFVAGKIAGVLTAWQLFRRSQFYRQLEATWRLSGAYVRRILSIGLPSGVQVLVRNFGMMAFYGILNRLPHGTEVVAAFAIGFGIESLAFLPVFALNIATATLVGQNLGAGRPAEAEATGWRIMRLAALLMGAFGVVFFTFAEPLAGLFTHDAAVRAFATDYLRIVALSEPFLGITMVLNGGLQGAGATRLPMMVTIGAQVMLRLPVAYVLVFPLGWGASGAWWALTGSLFVQAGMIAWLFKRGSWKEKVV